MSNEIGLVIAKGMQVLYKTNPKNPVDFLAKWLLNKTQVDREAVTQRQESERARQEQAKFEIEESRRIKAQDKAKEKDLLWEKQAIIFNEQIAKSSDLSEQLQLLNDHLHTNTNATAVYIGKVVQAIKPIKDSDNDKAHIDKTASSHIHFCHSDPGHSFIVGQVLEPGQGVTYEVFEDPKEGDEQKTIDNEGNPIQKMKLVEGE